MLPPMLSTQGLCSALCWIDQCLLLDGGGWLLLSVAVECPGPWAGEFAPHRRLRCRHLIAPAATTTTTWLPYHLSPPSSLLLITSSPFITLPPISYPCRYLSSFSRSFHPLIALSHMYIFYPWCSPPLYSLPRASRVSSVAGGQRLS